MLFLRVFKWRSKKPRSGAVRNFAGRTRGDSPTRKAALRLTGGLDAATEALRLARESLSAGNAIIDDVLLAEDALNLARQHYTSAVVAYDKAQVALLAALGILDRTRLVPTSAQGG